MLGLVASKFRSSGQTCVCANRVYVQSSVIDRFADVLRQCIDKTFVYGSVWDRKVNFGPLYCSKGIAKVKEHLKDAVNKGAKLHSGGPSDHDDPNFFPPTIVTTSGEGMAFTEEETFGPIAFLMPFETEEEVIQRANDSDVGLAAYFHTQDTARLFRVSEQLQVGMVGACTGLVSAAEQPFGGIQESGLGREGGIAALEEYLNVKSITIGI